VADGPANWLERLTPGIENDPEYLRDRIALLEGELRHTYPSPRADVEKLIEAAEALGKAADEIVELQMLVANCREALERAKGAG